MKEQKKSSWGAVLVSFLKEFLLNSFEAPGHLYYDENLTNEGKRKKNYIWRVLLLVTAVGVALLPVIAWNMFVPDVLSLASVCRKITSVQRNVVVIHQRTQAKPYISVPQVANLSKERDG